jgi:hypothetical protein
MWGAAEALTMALRSLRQVYFRDATVFLGDMPSRQFGDSSKQRHARAHACFLELRRACPEAREDVARTRRFFFIEGAWSETTGRRSARCAPVDRSRGRVATCTVRLCERECTSIRATCRNAALCRKQPIRSQNGTSGVERVNAFSHFYGQGLVSSPCSKLIPLLWQSVSSGQRSRSRKIRQ